MHSKVYSIDVVCHSVCYHVFSHYIVHACPLHRGLALSVHVVQLCDTARKPSPIPSYLTRRSCTNKRPTCSAHHVECSSCGGGAKCRDAHRNNSRRKRANAVSTLATASVCVTPRDCTYVAQRLQLYTCTS